MTPEEIAVKIEAVDSRSKNNSEQIKAIIKHQEENDKMLNTISLIAQRQDTMDGDIKEIKTDVKILTGKPARRWELVVDKIVLAVAAGLAAYILARLGLG